MTERQEGVWTGAIEYADTEAEKFGLLSLVIDISPRGLEPGTL